MAGRSATARTTGVPGQLAHDQAVRDDAGEISHYFGILEDVTTRKNWQERFNYLAWYAR
jgi:hypothetical protein